MLEQLEIIYRTQNDTEDTWILRVLDAKYSGELDITYYDIMNLYNSIFPEHQYTDSSSIRKRYAVIKKKLTQETPDIIVENTLPDETNKQIFETQKYNWRVKHEASIIRNVVKTHASLDAFLEGLEASAPKYPLIRPHLTKSDRTQKATYVLLSDLHIGIKFDNQFGCYNADIAEKRLCQYASEIIDEARKQNSTICYISLLGDLISGNIHTNLRAENELTLCDQILKSSQLISSFIYGLSQYFSQIYVNNVVGNHSRADPDLKNSLRSERLDYIVYKMIQKDFDKNSNVDFAENKYDPTVGMFTIFNYNFFSVHGDLDSKVAKTIPVIEHNTGERVDYIICGHNHHIECKIDDVGYIMSGSLCGSGDDYSISKRLSGSASQVFMFIDETGVTSIHPVRFSKHPVFNKE